METTVTMIMTGSTAMTRDISPSARSRRPAGLAAAR
jgi:hypothetical protein